MQNKQDFMSLLHQVYNLGHLFFQDKNDDGDDEGKLLFVIINHVCLSCVRLIEVNLN